MQYKVDDVEVSKVVAKNEDATIYTNILPEGTLEAKITAKVNESLYLQLDQKKGEQMRYIGYFDIL